jgi:type IX secretion system PorP/SprF family membrane protein
MKTYLSIIIAVMLFSSLQAQEKTLLYSHYSFSGLAINPAYAGSREMLSVTISHRSQWTGFDGAPSYNVAGIHTPFKNTKMGLGFLVMNESIGLRKYTGFYFNYAHRLKVGKGKLALGLKGGLATGKMETLDLGEDDYLFGENSNSYLLPNFGVGIYYYTRNFYAGLSVPLILGYKAGDNGEVMAYHDFSKYSYYLTTGVTLKMADRWKLQPSALAAYDRSGGIVADAGLKLLYRDILSAGASYRTKQAIVMLLDYKITYQLRVGMAYDYGLNEINEYNRSSFEIALEYNFGYQIKASNPTLF